MAILIVCCYGLCLESSLLVLPHAIEIWGNHLLYFALGTQMVVVSNIDSNQEYCWPMFCRIVKKSNCILGQWFVILVPTFPHRWWWCIWVPAHCGWQVVPLLYGFKVCDLVIGSGM